VHEFSKKPFFQYVFPNPGRMLKNTIGGLRKSLRAVVSFYLFINQPKVRLLPCNAEWETLVELP